MWDSRTPVGPDWNYLRNAENYDSFNDLFYFGGGLNTTFKGDTIDHSSATNCVCIEAEDRVEPTTSGLFSYGVGGECSYARIDFRSEKGELLEAFGENARPMDCPMQVNIQLTQYNDCVFFNEAVGVSVYAGLGDSPRVQCRIGASSTDL